MAITITREPDPELPNSPHLRLYRFTLKLEHTHQLGAIGSIPGITGGRVITGTGVVVCKSPRLSWETMDENFRAVIERLTGEKVVFA